MTTMTPGLVAFQGPVIAGTRHRAALSAALLPAGILSPAFHRAAYHKTDDNLQSVASSNGITTGYLVI